MISIFTQLQIPYDKKFYNLPFSHYELLAETKGITLVSNSIRELIVYYKDDKIVSEKARVLLKKLQKEFLIESVSSEQQCECGFMFLGQEYEKCPVCSKSLYEDKECYYKNSDNSCSLDGTICDSIPKECQKK